MNCIGGEDHFSESIDDALERVKKITNHNNDNVV